MNQLVNGFCRRFRSEVDWPFRERLCACDNDAAFLVPSGHYLSKQLGACPVNFSVSSIIDDQDIWKYAGGPGSVIWSWKR